ncbi:hypothetical protein G3A39_42795 [Paraburkholderia aspalathi]|nr:hypothetical protein [Paraburkholderia aspalathi]
MAFRAIARATGETVRIEPRISSEYADAEADPDRPIREVTATVAFTPVTDNLDGSRQGTKINTTARFSQRSASIWLTPNLYNGLGFEIVEGDAVVMVKRPKEPKYVVSRDPIFSDRGDVSILLVMDGNQ